MADRVVRGMLREKVGEFDSDVDFVRRRWLLRWISSSGLRAGVFAGGESEMMVLLIKEAV